MLETTRTYRAKIVNHSQLSDDLNQCGFSTSKLWNVARYYTQGRWDEDGEIPDDGELKQHERDSDFHSQSSQRVLEELAESFTSWDKTRQRGDEDDNTRLP